MKYRKGAVGGLLDEYEKAILELQTVLKDISDQELITIADAKTEDKNCRSVQTVMAHVVRAVYSYAIYIKSLSGIDIKRPDELYLSSAAEYIQQLDDAFAFTVDVFKGVEDQELEEFNASKKILTSWGQLYDIEQLSEHAIVHILRHRRQIQRFKGILRNLN